MKRTGVLLLAAVVGWSLADASTFAESKPAATPRTAAPAKPPAIDPAALALIKATSDKLAAAKSISFITVGGFDAPARNGQPLLYFTRSEVLMVRPSKLRVIVPGDGPPSEFYFDGKTIAVFQPFSDFIATTDAPGTLEEALEAIYKKAGLYFPFVDFIVADPYATLTTGLTSAFVIGTSKIVGGTETNIVSLSNKDTHLQIWIGAEDKLPRLVWATPINRPREPRHMVEFSDWKLTGEVATSEIFAPKTKPSTKQIPFARPESLAAKKH
jgi:hypothetical protein